MEIPYNDRHFNFFAYFIFKLPHNQSATWLDSCCFIFRALQTLSQIKFLKYMDPSFAKFGPKLDASSRPKKRHTNTTIKNTCNCSLQIQPSLLAPNLLLRMFCRKATMTEIPYRWRIVDLEVTGLHSVEAFKSALTNYFYLPYFLFNFIHHFISLSIYLSIYYYYLFIWFCLLCFFVCFFFHIHSDGKPLWIMIFK